MSTLLLAPTTTSVANLAAEGLVSGVHHVGDVMFDISLQAAERASTGSDVLERLGLTAGAVRGRHGPPRREHRRPGPAGQDPRLPEGGRPDGRGAAAPADQGRRRPGRTVTGRTAGGAARPVHGHGAADRRRRPRAHRLGRTAEGGLLPRRPLRDPAGGDRVGGDDRVRLEPAVDRAGLPRTPLHRRVRDRAGLAAVRQTLIAGLGGR